MAEETRHTDSLYWKAPKESCRLGIAPPPPTIRGAETDSETRSNDPGRRTENRKRNSKDDPPITND